MAAIIDSPKTPVAQAAPSPKLKISNQVFTVGLLAACMNGPGAKNGVEFEGCSLIHGRTIVPMDKDGRTSPSDLK